MSRRLWRQRAAASLLRSRRRSLLRISSGVMSSVRILLFGPGKRFVEFGCPPFVNCCCHSWLLSSSEKSLLCVNSFSKALSVDSIVARVVGVNTRFDGSVGIAQPICRYTHHVQKCLVTGSQGQTARTLQYVQCNINQSTYSSTDIVNNPQTSPLLFVIRNKKTYKLHIVHTLD